MTLSFHKRPVRFRPVGDFSIHPLVANDPRLAPRDPRYLRMQAAWEEQDGCPAVYATAAARVVDGRHRLWWLQQAGAEEVPWIEVTEEEAPLVALAQLLGRNHLTKGQQAYVAAPKLALAFRAAQQRRLAILQSGGRLKLPPVQDSAALADRLGICETLLKQARRLHDAFHGGDGERLRKEWEPKILDAETPVGLGAALAGIAGAAATRGYARQPVRNTALNNLVVGLRNLVRPAGRWLKFDAAGRELVLRTMEDSFSKLPPDVLEAIDAAIRSARARLSAQHTAE